MLLRLVVTTACSPARTSQLQGGETKRAGESTLGQLVEGQTSDQRGMGTYGEMLSLSFLQTGILRQSHTIRQPGSSPRDNASLN